MIVRPRSLCNPANSEHASTMPAPISNAGIKAGEDCSVAHGGNVARSFAELQCGVLARAEAAVRGTRLGRCCWARAIFVRCVADLP